MKLPLFILTIFIISFATAGVKNIHVQRATIDTPRVNHTINIIKDIVGKPRIELDLLHHDQGLRPSYMPREAAIRDAMDTLRQLSFFIGRKLSDGQADRYRQSFMIAWNRLDSLTLK